MSQLKMLQNSMIWTSLNSIWMVTLTFNELEKITEMFRKELNKNCLMSSAKKLRNFKNKSWKNCYFLEVFFFTFYIYLYYIFIYPLYNVYKYIIIYILFYSFSIPSTFFVLNSKMNFPFFICFFNSFMWAFLSLIFLLKFSNT